MSDIVKFLTGVYFFVTRVYSFFSHTALCIFFAGTWGDLHYLGLTGLEVLGETFEAIPLTLDMLEVSAITFDVMYTTLSDGHGLKRTAL